MRVPCHGGRQGRTNLPDIRHHDQDGLKSLLAWLTEQRCAHVAMEATGGTGSRCGTFLSDGTFELLVANAAHIKNVPGRKTDDQRRHVDPPICWRAAWIKGSFVLPARRSSSCAQPPGIPRKQRPVSRPAIPSGSRRRSKRPTSSSTTSSARSLGVSLGGAMIEAMIAGVTSPRLKAALADRRIKASPRVLYDALHGRLDQASPLPAPVVPSTSATRRRRGSSGSSRWSMLRSRRWTRRCRPGGQASFLDP